jgi:hypothetical protein
MNPTTRRDFLAQSAGGFAAFATAGMAAAAIRPAARPTPLRIGADVGVGVIGCGRQGRSILSELAKLEVPVKGACATRSRAGCLRAFGGPRAPRGMPIIAS